MIRIYRAKRQANIAEPFQSRPRAAPSTRAGRPAARAAR